MPVSASKEYSFSREHLPEHAGQRGGDQNTASEDRSTVGGGNDNTASGVASTVAGGTFNSASGEDSTVGGGERNTAEVEQATVGGGVRNTASGLRATVGGGNGNTASGVASTIAGGVFNTAGGNFSFAGGRLARVRNEVDVDDEEGGSDLDGDEGTFVWSDATTLPPNAFESTGPNQFLINATGGVGMGTNDPLGHPLTVRTATART